MVEMRITLACAFALLIAQGCATQSQRTRWPERRPLGREFAVRNGPRDAEKPVEGEVTLRRALGLALLRSPRLATISWDVRIAEARRLQAGLLPNPEIEVEVEEFGGTGGRTGFDGSEATIVISQLVELGHKRALRKRAAALDAELSAWDYEAERLAVVADTALSFLDVLGAQEQLRLAEESHGLAQEVFSAIAERVKAGKVSPLEEMRAGVTLAQSSIELDKKRRDLSIARGLLAATWGSTTPGFGRAAGRLDVMAPIPPFETIKELVARNPEVARWAKEMEQRLAMLALERAGRIPDLTVSAGVQRFAEDGGTSFLFGFSIPLPLFDRNQGGIAEARHRIGRAGDAKKAAEVRMRTALAGAYEVLASARGEALSLRDDVLPVARRAYAATRESYLQGKVGYLDILDAQQTLVAARQSHVDALVAYHKAVAIVESLIGTALGEVKQNGE